uniref:SXP/RAL-2 family protein Ani s 5-like cation-binding domain-containing protein n=1 Tax=Panagrellus redivivus TaxID=6233 RepID=A0A7E4VFL6_PANRE
MRSMMWTVAFLVVLFDGVALTMTAPSPPLVQTRGANADSISNYIRNYVVADFSKILDLLKDEKSLGSSMVLPFGITTDKPKPWVVLSKVDSLFDQLIILWKDHGAKTSVDVSEAVHTIFDAKYNVQEFIFGSRDLFEKAKNERSNNLKVVNALKKDAGLKIDLASDVVKRVVDDLVTVVSPFDGENEKEYYRNLIGVSLDSRK